WSKTQRPRSPSRMAPASRLARRTAAARCRSCTCRKYGKISALAPDKAKEIKTGAFGTVHAGQFIHVESTAEGTGGEFYDLVQEADARQKEGHTLSPLDFRLHFFPWHGHHGYRLPADTSLPGELIDYFAEIKGKHGIELTAEQKAWYAAKRR